MIPKDEFKKYATKHMGMSTMHLENFMEKSVQGITVPQVQNFTPAVIEERQLNVAQMDVFSRLMMDRIIFMGVAINDYVSNVVQAQLLFLESTDPKRDIQLFINSPGGSVIDGFGIYDTMQYVSPDVSTICTGMAASMGAFLLCSGVKGKRSALTHSMVMIHQPSGGMQGQFSDMEISYNLIKSLRQSLYTIIAENCGKTFKEVEKDSDRDNWMSSAQAKDYGMIDEVLTRGVKKDK